MRQCVGDDHEDVEEAGVADDGGEGDDVTHQQQEQKDDPVERLALKLKPSDFVRTSRFCVNEHQVKFGGISFK